MPSIGRRQLLRGGLGIAGLGLLAGCGVVSFPGWRHAGPRRVGFLESGTASPSVDAFREGMRELGYVEGQSFILEYRTAEGNLAHLPDLVRDLVDARVEVIVTRDSPTAVSQGASTIPIVAAGADIVAAGLVSNIAHPEGNLTGLTTNAAGTVGKWVELLKEAVPSITSLAMLQDLSSPFAQVASSGVQRAAEALQTRLTAYDLRDLDQLSAVLGAARSDSADGLVVVSGGILGGGADPRIGSAVMASGLPSVAEARPFVVNGGLLAHGTNGLVLAKRSAAYVDKILRGAKPGDLPIELPTEFTIVVNLRAARALGLTIPNPVLARATEILR